MIPEKKTLRVFLHEKAHDIAWYHGASDASIERAVRAALALPEGAPLTLRDSEGATLALSDSLPSGLEVKAFVGGSPTQLIAPPGPAPYPIVGNIPHLTGGENLNATLASLLKEHGELVRLKVRNNYAFLCSSPEMVSELLNRPDDFQKAIPERSALGSLRAHTTGDGLFTSADHEPAWQIAHRVLLPAFGLGALKQYYPRLQEVTSDLLAHLEKLGDQTPFLATDLMTRMTFEAISYAGFNTRFNTLKNEAQPPFVGAMIDVLNDAMAAPTQIFPEFFRPGARKRRQRADQILRDTVDPIIRGRREALARGEVVPSDMLQLMLTSRDKSTGAQLSDENIRNQLITFLIAGHETTSGLLSYALYYLTANPEIEAKLLEEVDHVLGRDYSYQPSFQDIERLDYTARVLKEALRLEPTAPAFAKMTQRDTTLDGRYALPKDSPVLVFLPALHRNPRHWGEHPERFNPDHFSPEAVAARHPNAYHPFGLGVRSCIGFQFALIEAKLVLARFYQRFLPRTADKGYKLQHEQTLTLKPKELRLVLTRRPEVPGGFPAVAATPIAPALLSPATGRPMLVLYGSNMGTSKELADALARQAASGGFSPVVCELDARVAQLPRGAPVLIVASTYNGTPPDNAARFYAWLSDPLLPKDALQGVRFAVLGCGNKQWRSTFQRFPRFLAQRMSELGAEPFYELGVCDADADFDAAAEAWTAGLWAAASAAFGVDPISVEDDARRYEVELVNFAGAAPHAVQSSVYPLQEAALPVVVRRNYELQASDSSRSTRHLEVELPRGLDYHAGDHLGVFPENPAALVEAISQRCGLRATDVVVLKERASTGEDRLPCGTPVMVRDLLTYHVDLLGPLSRKELRALAKACPCHPEQAALEALTGEEAYNAAVIGAKLHLQDLLERHRSIALDLGLLLSLRPLMKPRYYSISSSPRALSGACSITVGVLTAETPSERPHEGLCSHYLSRAAEGSMLRAFVRDTKSAFRMPSDPSRPLLLIGPGTGLAPLRGFLQERAAMRRDGAALGKTLLFFGCRHPAQDYLYRDELEELVEDGVLSTLEVAFSRVEGQPKVYVQDRLIAHAKEIAALLEGGGYVFVCGDARDMAPAVQKTLAALLASQQHLSPEDAQTRIETLKREGRYLEDVWAS